MYSTYIVYLAVLAESMPKYTGEPTSGPTLENAMRMLTLKSSHRISPLRSQCRRRKIIIIALDKRHRICILRWGLSYKPLLQKVHHGKSVGVLIFIVYECAIVALGALPHGVEFAGQNLVWSLANVRAVTAVLLFFV